MPAPRKAISKKARFEVFKRDKFTCQYCGAKSPDVVLHVDHITAVANGGRNDILNLITSCAACNGGKSATPLSDESAIQRQSAQLAELEERRQQIEMMVNWRAGLAEQDDVLLKAFEAEFQTQALGRTLTATGRARAKAAIKRYGFPEMFDSIGISVAQYGEWRDGKLTDDSASKVFHMISRIAANRKKYGGSENVRDLAYIQGILRNRTGQRWLKVIDQMQAFVAQGLSIEFLKSAAEEVESLSDFDEVCWCEIWRREREAKHGGR